MFYKRKVTEVKKALHKAKKNAYNKAKKFQTIKKKVSDNHIAYCEYCKAKNIEGVKQSMIVGLKLQEQCDDAQTDTINAAETVVITEVDANIIVLAKTKAEAANKLAIIHTFYATCYATHTYTYTYIQHLS